MAVTPLVAIVGRPNVGKSTLFNRLVGTRRAITDDAAGTTRDAVYGVVDWRGQSFVLVDTAGLQRADSELEEQVQQQIAQVSQEAQLLIVVADAAAMATNDDLQAARLALKSKRPVILVLNKIDAAHKKMIDDFTKLGIKNIIQASALHGRGSGDLLDAIVEEIEKVPQTEEPERIKVALLGRPNVGKSSLFNSLGSKQQAIVSDVSGTTRDLNFLELKYHGQSIELMDTAGLTRPGKTKPGVEKYSSLRTVSAIAGADICVIVMDAQQLGVAKDQSIAGLADDAGKGVILVVNKWDAVEKDDKTQHLTIAQLQNLFQFCWWAPLVFVSALTGENVSKLLELIVAIQQRRITKIATAPLNQLLGQLTAKQPPAGVKNHQPKLNYVTQTAIGPPTFTFFGTYPDLIHFSYRRYLENGWRETFDFSGTPIKLEFRDKRSHKE